MSGLAVLAREFILWQKSGQVQEYKSGLHCYISYEFYQYLDNIDSDACGGQNQRLQLWNPSTARRKSKVTPALILGFLAVMNSRFISADL